MATDVRLERMATVLVENSILGGSAACKKYRLSACTLWRWRSRLKADPELRRLFEQKMAGVGAEFADSLTTLSPLVVVRSDGRKGSNPRGVSRLADAAAAEIVSVAALAGLPEVKSVERGHMLPTGRRVSLFIAHRDATVTVCEVLAGSYEYDRPLGHLLFNYESVRMHYRLPASSVRLCVLADHDAPPLWRRVAANLKVEVGFYNIAEDVRARLSTQNVLTPEGARE